MSIKLMILLMSMLKGRKEQKERKTLFAWVLKDVVKTKPKRYSHSKASWCKTEN